MKHKRAIKRAEALAMSPDAIHSGPDAMWWDFWTPIPENSREGSVAVVDVRGSLDHHRGYGGDSYEAILDRVAKAMSGEDAREKAQRVAYWAEEGSPEAIVPDAEPPNAVILRIDSPGGVVSGLNQAVFTLRKMAEASGVPLIAYVNELACSAAYALACACDEIAIPPSGIAGSVGVISCMYDQVEADKKMGLNFATITSGTRKADGHPHVALSEAALNAEQRRVDRLAKQFYKLVAQKRPLSAKDVESYQAGIFIGQEAVTKGLADVVAGWDEVVQTLSVHNALVKPKENGSSTRIAAPQTAPAKGPRNMLLTLRAEIKRATAKLEAEKDPAKKKALAATVASYQSALEAYKKEKHTVEKHETEEGDDDEDKDEDGDEEESAESKSDDKAETKEEKCEDDEDDDEAKKASAELATLAESATGKRGRAAVGALAAVIEQGKRNAAVLDEIVRERKAEKKASAIEKALNARRITKHEAKTLAGKSLAFVTSFLEMRPKAVINVDDDSIRIPDPDAKSPAGAELASEVIKQIDLAVVSAPDGVDKAILRKQMIEAHEKRMQAASNGAGRY